jgi:hypothetical protein
VLGLLLPPPVGKILNSPLRLGVRAREVASLAVLTTAQLLPSPLIKTYSAQLLSPQSSVCSRKIAISPRPLRPVIQYVFCAPNQQNG